MDNIEPDPLPDPYVLELSSPGAERPIKTQRDWQQAKGQYIHVGLYQKIENNKMYEGTLIDFDEDQIELEIKVKTRKKIMTIPRSLIANIRFAIEF